MIDDVTKRDLMRELGIDTLPPEEQEAAFTRMGGIIFQKVMMRAMDVLSDADQEEMDRLIAANPEDGTVVASFLAEKIADFEALVVEEAANFRKSALEVMDRLD